MKNKLSSLAVRRRHLQHSADGEYPCTDPANAGMRRKFDLPPGPTVESVTKQFPKKQTYEK